MTRTSDTASLSKILLFVFVIFFISYIPVSIFAQVSTINYSGSTLSGTACNVFSAPVTIGGVSNTYYAGGVKFKSGSGISLNTTPQSSPIAGTAYVLNYVFTPGDTYNISITTSGGSGKINLNTSVIPNFTQFPTQSTSTTCSPDASVGSYITAGFGRITSTISSASHANVVPAFTITGNQAYQYLIIWASAGDFSLSLDGFYISSITITQTTPTCSLATTGLTTSNGGSVLNWTANGASKYNVAITDNYLGTPTTTNSTVTTNSISFCARGNGDNVSFTVQSVCSSGLSGPVSSPYSFTTAYPPSSAPPTGLMYTSPSTLSWNPVTGVSTYIVVVTQIPGGSGAYPVTGTSVSGSSAELSTGKSYSVTVASDNSCFPGTPSAPITFTVPSCSPSPSFAVVEGNFVILYPVSGAVSYNVGFRNSSGVIVYQINNIPTTITTSGYTVTGVPHGSYYLVAEANCTIGTTSWGAPYFGGLQTFSIKNTGEMTSTPESVDNILDGKPGLSISPNPANSQINVTYNTENGGRADIFIVNELGGQLVRKSVGVTPGKNNFQLNIGRLANGVYIVKIINGNNTFVKKLVIQR
jgi:Secretion system C-terminal sorting domain